MSDKSMILVVVEDKKKILKFSSFNQLTMSDLQQSIKSAFGMDPDQQFQLEYLNKEFNEYVDLDEINDLPREGIKLKVKKLRQAATCISTGMDSMAENKNSENLTIQFNSSFQYLVEKDGFQLSELKDVWILIFEYLDPITLLRVRLVNKYWAKIAKSNNLWRMKCYELFPHAAELHRSDKDIINFPKDGINWWKFYWELLHEENLVLNPIFKNNSNTWSCDGSTTTDLTIQVKQWKQEVGGRESMSWARTPEQSFVGKFSMKGKGGDDAPSKRIATSFPLRKNDVVVVSSWVKSYTKGDACIFTQCSGGDYYWNESKRAFHSGSGEWELLRTSFGPITSDTTCYFFLWNNSKTTYAFFDHCFANTYVGDSEELKKLLILLFQYAKEGNTKEMEVLLYTNPQYKEQFITAEDSIGKFTALYRACQAGHLEVAKILVEYGFDLESKKGDGSTPLYIACQENRVDVVNYLISKGADIETVFKTGFRPMYISAQKGHLEVVKILVENGAKVDAASDEGATPLYIACQNAHNDTVKYLLAHGANIEVKFKNSFTPLYISAQKGHLEVVKTLVEHGAIVDAESSDGGATPLYIGCQNGHREVADYLISKGADIQKLFKGCFVPLYIAAQKGNKEVVKLLLERGAQVDFRLNTKTATPLYTAAQNGHLEVCKILLDHGADVNSKYQDYYTPVYISAQKGHLEVLKFLLERGGDIDAPCSRGSTALYVAAQNGHLECVKELVNRGANPDVIFDNGIEKRTPLDIAAEKNYGAIENVLQQYQFDRKRKKNAAFLDKQEKEKKQKAELPSKQEDITTPLNTAVRGDLPEEDATTKVKNFLRTWFRK